MKGQPWVVLGTLAALGLAGCGGGETKTVTVEKRSSAATTATEPSTPTTPTAAGSEDCNALGINAERGAEGACVEDGRKLRVVNRTTPLALNEIGVRNVSVTLADSLTGLDGPEVPAGKWVKVTMTITNRMNVPFEIQKEQFSLLTNEASYGPDFDVMNNPGNSCLWESEEIQPGNSKTCWIAFDVSKKNSAHVEEDGNLFIAQPSEDNFESPTKRLGVIRLYG